MEFLYLLGGLIALLLGTDTATKGLSGLVQQAGASALTAGLVLVGVGYALPGLALIAGAAAWQGLPVAATAAQGAMLGTLGLGASGLLISTGLVLRVRPWRMLDGDKAQAELAEFAASREGWGRNTFRLVLGAALLVAGARGVLAGAPFFALAPGVDAGGALVVSATLGIGAAVAIVATFNARFGDAAAAYAAILGGGALLVGVAVIVAVLTAMPAFDVRLLAHPLPQGLALLGLLAAVAKPAKPLGRGLGLAVLAATVVLLATALVLLG
jgi:cation:H+ antiporter